VAHTNTSSHANLYTQTYTHTPHDDGLPGAPIVWVAMAVGAARNEAGGARHQLSKHMLCASSVDRQAPQAARRVRREPAILRHCPGTRASKSECQCECIHVDNASALAGPCVFKCASVCTCISLCVYTCVSVCLCVHSYVYVCICVFKCVWACVCIYMCVSGGP
jgi:hypothetical protein